MIPRPPRQTQKEKHTMKKNMILGILAVAAACGAVIAGSVYDRTTVALSVTAGTGSWTNPYEYGAVKLARLTMVANTDAGATVTVSRVTSDNTYTQAVATLIALNSTNVTTLASQYLLYGDKLTFASSTATGGTAMVEFEVQKH
jgi:hypothetical protein